MSTATLDISEARREFSKLPERLREEQVIWVTRHNKKAFAVVDMELMEAVIETLEILRDPDALKLFQESLDDIRHGRLIDHEEIERELTKESQHGRTSSFDPVDGDSARLSSRVTKKRKQGHRQEDKRPALKRSTKSR